MDSTKVKPSRSPSSSGTQSSPSVPYSIPRGVMFNAYPDSIGTKLACAVEMLKRPELEGAFSLFYVLPTIFNSDLDRGFSVIDYDLNHEMVSRNDLDELARLGILLKVDLVLNHLSVGSPQFKDLLANGDNSQYKDFFIDWNEFWRGHGEMSEDGYVIPKDEHLKKLFMRKPGLPILKLRFPDGSVRPYWNTFYQEVTYQPIAAADLVGIEGLTGVDSEEVVALVNNAMAAKEPLDKVDFGALASFRDAVLTVVDRKARYLGQMDLNAQSPKVWEFYRETFRKLKSYGTTLVRLDAFAYLHKEPGKVNFFNKPETWEYLARLRELATEYDLILLPEIHSEYGQKLHEEVAGEGFPIYDFFFPGLVIDAIDRATRGPLSQWIKELQEKGMVTVNMLGCHDGIPVLDLKGPRQGSSGAALLTDDEIEAVVERVLARGGRVKNLYGPDGKKISYYQVNATFFSALGESEQKLLVARAIQMFMPGIPQVWYLDLFAGKNNYEAADRGGAAGHKEINRTSITIDEVEQGLRKSIVIDQLWLISLRNNSPAFRGSLEVMPTSDSILNLVWRGDGCEATLWADLSTHEIRVSHRGGALGTLERHFAKMGN